MSKDIKNLIDTVEEENKIRAKFEQDIDVLKEEINRLNFTIKEQKVLIANQKSRLLEFQEKSPENVKELKDTIANQKQDLVKRYKDINNLNQQIQELTNQLENYKKLNSQTEVNEELIKAKKIIVKLNEEKEQTQNQIESLKEQLEKEQTHNHQVVENQDLIDLKKQNFQLMEENGLLRVQIERLKAQIQNESENAQSEKLDSANKEIETLKEDIEEYKAKINYLQTKEKEIADDTKEIEETKKQLLKFQKENERLNQQLVKLKEKKHSGISIQPYIQSKVPLSFPKSYLISLFIKMYSFLDDTDKDKIIELLIEDLRSQNNEIKRNIIEFLSEIRDKKVYDAFVKLVNDKDWLIRYNLVKAILKFKKKRKELKKLLEKLSKDTDVDVRELAIKALKDLSE